MLKGAMLFTVWSKHPHRATKDLDLLGAGVPDLTRLQDVFRNVCVIDVEDDGLVFDPGSVTAARIKEDEEYEGVRVTLNAKLGSAKLALQVDVGFGDAVTPAAVMIEYPSLLAFPAAKLRAYPRETVVAEKLHAMIHLGMANSRMKDFFDVWFLCGEFDFDGQVLRQAIRATLDRRKTAIPVGAPTALTDAFANDGQKQTQWKAFLDRSRVATKALTLREVVTRIAAFLVPALEAARLDDNFETDWHEGGPWVQR